MLSIADALGIIGKIQGIKDKETLPLLESLGRVVSEPIHSKIDHPPFVKSAMDGYAVSSQDPSRSWVMLETIAAGQVPGERVTPGHCSKIMTGAMMPAGADSVVVVENTEPTESGVRMVRGELRPGDNVSQRGEDAKSGDLVADRGSRISPQLLGSIAACGWDNIEVYRRPRLTILTTGDEIVLPGQALKPGQIYNSNGYSLAGQFTNMGLAVHFAGCVSDTPEAVEASITEFVGQTDVLLLSGGVSMGDFDFVPSAIQRLGGTIHFAKVAIKPGKPTLFATLRDCLIFGLPGNPVSTFVISEILVKPAMHRLMNLKEPVCEVSGRLSEAIRRKKADRTAYIPVRWCGNRVETVEYHGSAHLLALPRANGLVCMERGVAEWAAGSEVRVRLFQT